MRRLFYILLLIGIFSPILSFSITPCPQGCVSSLTGDCPPEKPERSFVSGEFCCCPATPPPTQPSPTQPQQLSSQLINPIEHETFGDLIDAIITFIFNIALVIAPLFIIIGGFYFVTASGDPSKIDTGKRIIFYTLLGFFIILISRGLVEVIKGFIEVVE